MGMGMGMPGMGVGRGLTQEQSQKIADAVHLESSRLSVDLADAQKAAVNAALAKDATEANIKAKIEAVVALQVKLAMLRYTKGIQPIVKDLTDEQKTQLTNTPATIYNQLFLGRTTDFVNLGGTLGGGR
jgi:Spy/CpxP family protein refolding chaperone